MKHENDGACAKCQEIFDKYHGFYMPLREWFELMQLKYPEFHCAEAGRGKVAQTAFFVSGRSRAEYGKSAHNANAAIDTFFMVNGLYTLDQNRYDEVVKSLPDFIRWYGAPGSPFYERPHFEVLNWKSLLKQGDLELVEPL